QGRRGADRQPDPGDEPRASGRDHAGTPRGRRGSGRSDGVALGTARCDAVCVEVLGRQNELEALTGFVDAVVSGPAGFILEGEPGIGKTTVWDAGVATARERSYRVLWCRPAGSEVQLSFASLGDLLEGVLEESLDELPAPQRRALEVALLLDDPQGPPPDQ